MNAYVLVSGVNGYFCLSWPLSNLLMTTGLLASHRPTPPSATPIQNWIPEDDSGRSWTQLGTAPRPPTARSTNGHRIVKRGGLNDGDRWA